MLNSLDNQSSKNPKRKSRVPKEPKVHLCPACNKIFPNSSHPKKIIGRIALKDNDIQQRAFRLYLYFCEEQVTCYKPTYEKFIESREYNHFMKFIERLNPDNKDRDLGLFQWVLKRRIKTYQWSLEETLLEYVKWTNMKESIGDATTRTINFIENYCFKIGLDLTQYFELVHNNTIARHIREGNVSPWFLFASSKGKKVLSEFNELNYERCGDTLIFSAWEVAIDRNFEQFLQLSKVLDEHGI